MTPRLPWLDYARVILLALIVLHHSQPRVAVFDQMLVDLAMPAFFVLSGILYKAARYRADFRSFVATRWSRLLVPYFAISAFFYVLWLIVGRRLAGGEDLTMPWWQPAVEILRGEPHTVVGTFWFVACLVSMQVLYYIIDRWLPRRWHLPVALALAVASRLLPGFGVWNMSNAMVYLPLFVTGSLTRDYWLDERQIRLHVAAVALVASVALMYLAVVHYGYLTMPYAALNLLAVGLLIVPLAALCGWLTSRYGSCAWVTTVSTASLAYLAMQNYGIGLCKVALMRLLTTEVFEQSWWFKPLIAIVVFIACYPPAVLILRYAPWLTGARNKA